MTNQSDLMHYGIPRRSGRYPWGSGKNPYQGDDIKKSKASQDSKDSKEASGGSSNSKSTSSTKSSSNPKKMTDEELKKKIERLELEKRYKDLSKSQVSEGKKFVFNILKNSGNNILTQLTTYGMGVLINKIFEKYTGEKVVNPKKGQKDK